MLHWSSTAVEPQSRFDAWQSALNLSHQPWALGQSRGQGFFAEIASATAGELEIVRCRCDPCYGSRTKAMARASDDGHYGILFLRSGRERVRQGDFAAELTPGSAVVWDTGQPCDFDVLEPLDKCTLFIAKDALAKATGQSHLPTGVMDTTRGIGALLLSRVTALSGMLSDLDEDALTHLGRSLAGDVILATGASRAARIIPPRRALMERIGAIIATGFEDPDFGPATVAARAGISLRYLHQLFQAEDETVSTHIQRVRLNAIAADLRDPDLAQASLTQIGFARGFSSASHFSRAFRAQFGMSPSSYRQG